eukprot:TRINITY_DN10118_c0_g1_i1.p2 TRINITY_DN10118_c0_g1~~TRINITY_DN10118_c0_g1_i1.p2  ORF type:complete len:122 (+),score=67.97 TRINITY_DN10118_c0_g1_i1:43-366(+)
MSPRSEIVKNYMSSRISKNNEQVVSLVADNITLVSSKDGTYEGKEAFAQYIDKVDPSGTFDEEPTLQEDGSYILKGKVRFLLMDWNVRVIFFFNADDKIEKIDIARV